MKSAIKPTTHKLNFVSIKEMNGDVQENQNQNGYELTKAKIIIVYIQIVARTE